MNWRVVFSILLSILVSTLLTLALMLGVLQIAKAIVRPLGYDPELAVGFISLMLIVVWATSQVRIFVKVRNARDAFHYALYVVPGLNRHLYRKQKRKHEGEPPRSRASHPVLQRSELKKLCFRGACIHAGIGTLLFLFSVTADLKYGVVFTLIALGVTIFSFGLSGALTWPFAVIGYRLVRRN